MTKNTRLFIRYWLPLIVYVLFVFMLSVFSRNQIDLRFKLSDKAIHFIEFGILAVLMTRGFSTLAWPRTWWQLLLVAVISVSLVGVIDEFVQSLVPSRTADINDWIADSLGGLTGAVSYMVARRLFVGRAIRTD